MADAIVSTDAVTQIFAEVSSELHRAMKKFPQPNPTFHALVEEVGELSTALFEEPRANVRKEAVQVAVMALRLALEGDPTMNIWRVEHGLDPLAPQED